MAGSSCIPCQKVQNWSFIHPLPPTPTPTPTSTTQRAMISPQYHLWSMDFYNMRIRYTTGSHVEKLIALFNQLVHTFPTQMSVVHYVIKRTSGYTLPIKSKVTIVIVTCDLSLTRQLLERNV